MPKYPVEKKMFVTHVAIREVAYAVGPRAVERNLAIRMAACNRDLFLKLFATSFQFKGMAWPYRPTALIAALLR